MKDMLGRIENMLSNARKYILNFKKQINNGPYKYYPSSPEKHCLYATLEGLSMESSLGIIDNPSQAKALLDFMRNCQNPDGYFRCPGCNEDNSDTKPRSVESSNPGCSEDKNKDGLTFKTAMVLSSFDVFPKYPLPDGDIISGNIESYLKNIFMENNPYRAGSLVWKKTGLFALKLLLSGKDPAHDPYVRQIMDLLIQYQDRQSGFWFPKGDMMNGMNGLLKMRYGTFDLCGIEIPFPDKIVPSILSIQRADGRFGQSCADWNGVGLLAEIGRRTNQFRDNIIDAYRRIVPAFEKKQDISGAFRWESESAEEPYLKPTVVNVTGLLAMKCFMTHDNEGIEMIFGGIKLRKKIFSKKTAGKAKKANRV